MKRYDFIPGLVGAGAGLVDGTISTFVPATSLGGFGEHVPTAFEGLLVGAGLLGWGMDWNADVAYTLQAAGVFGLMRRVPAAINSLVGGTTAASVAAPAGCVGCGAQHGPSRDVTPPLRAEVAALMAPDFSQQQTRPVGGSHEVATGIL